MIKSRGLGGAYKRQLFTLIENRSQTNKPQTTKVWQLSYQAAFHIGMFQVLALIPGASRSGVTIFGAVILGCSRAVDAKLSSFMGIPAMFGASLLKFVKLVKFGFRFNSMEILYLILGMLVASLVSVYSIRLLMSWVKKNDFEVFGYYRIMLGVIVLTWYIIFTPMGRNMEAA